VRTVGRVAAHAHRPARLLPKVGPARRLAISSADISKDDLFKVANAVYQQHNP
jgi:hypothetical protein